MKKKLSLVVLSLVCALCCAFGLVACGGNDGGEGGDTAAKVGGTYYYCENGVLDDSLYVTFQNGKWTDDEDQTGEYSLSGNVITLYVTFQNEKIEFAAGMVNGDDISLDILSANAVYRKGEDIGNKPKAKTLAYALNDDKSSYTVTGIGGLTGDIVIPDEYKRKPVTAIAENAFANCADITGVVIGNRVVEVGKKAFYNCANLTSAKLGESVDKLAESTFENCKQLETVTVSASVKKIEYKAFAECGALADIYYTGTASDWAAIEFDCAISESRVETATPFYATYLTPTGQKEIYRTLYVNNEPLTAADLTDATAINPCCFFRYKYLESVTIGGTAEEIGELAFYGCESLTSLQFNGDSLKTVGRRAFDGYCAIESVKLPDSLKRIEEFAFNNCEQLLSVQTGNGVTYIGEGAFMGCGKLSTLTLGNRVNEISETAFYSCNALTSVTVPSSVIFIGAEAFMFTGLTSATFEKTSGWQVLQGNKYVDVENLEDTANAATLLKTSILSNGYSDYDWEQSTLNYTLSSDKSYYTVGNRSTACRSEIVIPASYNGKPVEALAWSAFEDCTSLTSITLPACIREIPSNAFYGCKSLKNVTIDGVSETYATKDGILYNADFTQIVLVPAGKTEFTLTSDVPDFMFQGNRTVKKVILAEGVTNIGNWAFQNCNCLTSVVIGNTVTSIGNGAFYACGLTSLIIPDSVTSIGERAFDNCDRLTDLQIGKGLTSISYAAFENCDRLTSVVIPDNVTSIGADAFQYCSTLSSIQMGNGVTDIGEGAFFDCPIESAIVPAIAVYFVASELKTLHITDNTEIGEDVFQTLNYESALKSISVNDNNPYYSSRNGILYNKQKTQIVFVPEGIEGMIAIPNSVTNIGEHAFDGCSNLSNVVIPNSVTSIAEYAFSGCSNLTNVVIPSSITSIGDFAFENCSSFTEIVLPQSVTSVGYKPFDGCYSLTIYCEAAKKPADWNYDWASNFHESCPVVWNYKKNDMTDYGSVYTVIDGIRYQLYYDTAVVCVQPSNTGGNVTIPASVLYKGKTYHVTGLTDGFYKCSGLISITIPNTLTSLATHISSTGVFANCVNLESINVDAGNPKYFSRDGVLYRKEDNRIAYMPRALKGSVVIPDGVTRIGDGSENFSNHDGLTSVTIPDSVTAIGGYAFNNCRNLLNIIYKGTKAQWEAITKDSSWDSGMPKYTVHCTDGDISKN